MNKIIKIVALIYSLFSSISFILMTFVSVLMFLEQVATIFILFNGIVSVSVRFFIVLDFFILFILL